MTVAAFDIKKAFFDRAVVIAAVDKQKRKNLSKAGAFVRTAARSSIRKRKKPAPPGKPPSSHDGGLKRNIFFGYDSAAESVLIGPVAFARGGGRAPRLIEKGGRITRRLRSGKRVRQHYRGNPFMEPAIDQEAPNAPGVWAGTVR